MHVQASAKIQPELLDAFQGFGESENENFKTTLEVVNILYFALNTSEVKLQ